MWAEDPGPCVMCQNLFFLSSHTNMTNGCICMILRGKIHCCLLFFFPWLCCLGWDALQIVMQFNNERVASGDKMMQVKLLVPSTYIWLVQICWWREGKIKLAWTLFSSVSGCLSICCPLYHLSISNILSSTSSLPNYEVLFFRLCRWHFYLE